MAKEVMLTTVDNPFDPFTQFDQWFQFDLEKGHNTCSFLAYHVETSPYLSDEENKANIEKAITEIIANDYTNTFTRVTRGD